MKDYLYFDEDSEDASISPKAVNIPEIIMHLQHEQTGENLAVSDSTSNSLSTPRAVLHTEVLTCISTLIPYLEALPCHSL